MLESYIIQMSVFLSFIIASLIMFLLTSDNHYMSKCHDRCTFITWIFQLSFNFGILISCVEFGPGFISFLGFIIFIYFFHGSLQLFKYVSKIDFYLKKIRQTGVLLYRFSLFISKF